MRPGTFLEEPWISSRVILLHLLRLLDQLLSDTKRYLLLLLSDSKYFLVIGSAHLELWLIVLLAKARVLGVFSVIPKKHKMSFPNITSLDDEIYLTTNVMDSCY